MSLYPFLASKRKEESHRGKGGLALALSGKEKKKT